MWNKFCCFIRWCWNLPSSGNVPPPVVAPSAGPHKSRPKHLRGWSPLGNISPLVLFLVFCGPAPAEPETLFHFFCDYYGGPIQEGSHNHPNQSFDRMFSYKQFSDGHYQAQFQIYGDWLPVKSKQGVIYHSKPQTARKSFDIERFNLKTSRLILSHVYHLSLKEYKSRVEEQKTNPHLIPYSEKPLPFLDSPAGEGYVSAGFDKSHWQCHQVSGVHYVLKKWGLLLMQILSSG